MTAEDVEQQIRRHPTANERFLLGLLDEARGKVALDDELRARVWDLVDRAIREDTGIDPWTLRWDMQYRESLGNQQESV